MLLEQKNNILNQVFKQILQYNIKKGKKATLENIFKKALFYIAKNKNTFKENPQNLVFKALINIISYFYLKTIKKRRKVFYKIQFITPQKQFFLLNSWFCTHLNKKGFVPTHIDLAHELKNLSLQKSKGIEKKNEYHSLILQHMPYTFIKKSK